MARRGAQRKEPLGAIAQYERNLSVESEQSKIDVITPEMAAKGCYQAENKGRRYFKLQHLDRLHKNGKLSHEQHQAGTWYRDQFDRGKYDSPKTQDFTRPRGDNVVDLAPHSSQQLARDNWRSARTYWPRDMIGFMDGFLLRDQYPSMRHKASLRRIADIQRALDAMARHLKLIPA